MGKVNPWLDEKISKLNSPPTINVLVQVTDPSMLQAVKSRLAGIQGVQVGRTAFDYIEATMPHQLVSEVAKIPGVQVHYNAPRTIHQLVLNDPLIGKFGISTIEVPYTPQQMMARFGLMLPNRLKTIPAPLFGLLPSSARRTLAAAAPKPKDVIILPTGETRKLTGVPENNKMKSTKVAVLDTGIGWPDPFLLHTTKGNIMMDATIEQPNPFDGLGHGHWCVTTAFGDSYNTRFGLCRGIADPEGGTLGSIKCLSTLGFGTTFSVISAMEKAYKWGAKVISMSLGGELQGGVDEDPECQVIQRLKDEVIFVVAAGNEGPGQWTVGSPGASPAAVTVGAWSPYYGGVAIFSSRGPNAPWYQENPDAWGRDQRKYGSDMTKPDVVAPGGGPVEEGQIPDMIYSGVRGWTDGMNDGTPGDGFDAMRGTSMATPAAAGLIALAVERGYVQTAEDVKRKMSRSSGGKSQDVGYGMITWEKLTGGA